MHVYRWSNAALKPCFSEVEFIKVRSEIEWIRRFQTLKCAYLSRQSAASLILYYVTDHHCKNISGWKFLRWLRLELGFHWGSGLRLAVRVWRKVEYSAILGCYLIIPHLGLHFKVKKLLPETNESALFDLLLKKENSAPVAAYIIPIRHPACILGSLICGSSLNDAIQTNSTN